VLAAWGITETGHKVLLGLAPGTKEDLAACRDFLRDLKRRNLVDPIVIIITDGAPGLIRVSCYLVDENWLPLAGLAKGALYKPSFCSAT
jgi:transposase-like protein